jgi:hypothetical protein
MVGTCSLGVAYETSVHTGKIASAGIVATSGSVYLWRPFLARSWSRPGADHAARPGPRRQPVAEVLAEHPLKQPDVCRPRTLAAASGAAPS